jgi:hypothetical protein
MYGNPLLFCPRSERGAGSFSNSVDEHPWETIIWGPLSKPLDVIESSSGQSRFTSLGHLHGDPHYNSGLSERVPCPNNQRSFPRRFSPRLKQSEVSTAGVALWLFGRGCALIRSPSRWVTLKKIKWQDDKGVQVRRNLVHVAG